MGDYWELEMSQKAPQRRGFLRWKLRSCKYSIWQSKKHEKQQEWKHSGLWLEWMQILHVKGFYTWGMRGTQNGRGHWLLRDSHNSKKGKWLPQPAVSSPFRLRPSLPSVRERQQSGAAASLPLESHWLKRTALSKVSLPPPAQPLSRWLTQEYKGPQLGPTQGKYCTGLPSSPGRGLRLLLRLHQGPTSPLAQSCFLPFSMDWTLHLRVCLPENPNWDRKATLPFINSTAQALSSFQTDARNIFNLAMWFLLIKKINCL